jgi:hypothetical protein
VIRFAIPERDRRLVHGALDRRLMHVMPPLGSRTWISCSEKSTPQLETLQETPDHAVQQLCNEMPRPFQVMQNEPNLFGRHHPGTLEGPSRAHGVEFRIVSGGASRNKKAAA